MVYDKPLSRFLRKCDETRFWAFESAILRNQYFGNFYPPVINCNQDLTPPLPVINNKHLETPPRLIT